MSLTTAAPRRDRSITFRKGVRPFGKRDVTGYLFGDLACNFSFDLITMYMFLFFTQTIGIELAHYAVIILVAKIMDGINDPIIGGWIDSRPSGPDGKFKRWIRYFAIPLSFSSALLFYNTSGWDYWAKVALAAGGYFLWDILYSFVNVPYGSMASVMTTDAAERTELSTARSIGGFIPNIIYGIAIPLVIYTTVQVDGQSRSVFQGEYMFWIALGTGVLALLSFWVLLRNTEERLVHLPESEAPSIEADATAADTVPVAKPRYNPFRAFLNAFRNRGMVGLALTAVVQILFINGATQLTALTYQLYFNNGQLNALGIFVTMIPMVIGATVGPALVRRFGKAEVSSYPLFGAALVYLAMLFLPISNPFVWWGMTALAGALSFGLAIYTWALIADVIDYQEYETGMRTEGTTYAAFSMLRKIAQGLGQALVPAMIALTIPGLILNNPQTWTPENVTAIKNMSVAFPLVGVLLVAACLIWVYPLNKKNLATVEKALGR